MKSKVLLLCCCLFCLSASAQLQTIKPDKWQIKKWTISLNGTQEMPRNMDLGTFYGMKGQDVPTEVSDYFTDGELTSMQCDNGELRVGVTLVPAGLTNTEINFSIVHIASRTDMMSFETDGPNDDNSFLHIESISDEFAIEAVFSTFHPVNRWINLYGGFGFNSGISYNNELCIYSQLGMVDGVVARAARSESELMDMEYQTTDECSSVNNGINQRLFMQVGIGFLIAKRLELGIDCRKGVGYRSNFGGELYATTQHSVGLGLRWVVPNKKY